MAPKGKEKKKGKGNSKKTENRAQEPTSDSIFKPEIISNILSRLPVKTLLRFRSVCKQWLKLISKPEFVTSHFRHSSSLQSTDSSIIIQSRNDGKFNHHVLVQYKPPLLPMELENPYPIVLPEMSIAGPVNGILCIFQPPLGDSLTLWNPAMNKSKMVKLSKTKLPQKMAFIVSVGLAFDSQKDDVLILRIFCARVLSGQALSKVEFEVRPTKSPLGYWKKEKSEEYFYIDRHICDATVKGEPYWLAYITPSFVPGNFEALVRFNVDEMELEWLPLPFVGAGDYNLYPVNFQDSVGMLMWEEKENSYIDVWSVDDEVFNWSVKLKVPLFGLGKILGCLRNGDIVAEKEDKVLFYDPYPCLFTDTSIVGPVNGYMCLFHPTWGDVITLWNQPENVITLWNQPKGQSRMVKLSETKSPQEYVASLGLAFDSGKNDLLVLRIFCSSTVQDYVVIDILRPMKNRLGWKNLKSDMHFRIDRRSTCDVIFKGEPYWLAYITDTAKSGQHEGLVYFNVGKMELQWLPLPLIRAGYYIEYLVNLEYSLGMITWEGRHKCYVDVWLMDDHECGWSKRYKVGPFFGIDGFMGCLRNGDILDEKHSGRLIMYDPVTCVVKYGLHLPDAKKGSHVIFDCPESLLLIEGMEAIKPQAGSECKKLLSKSRGYVQTV